MIILPCPLAGFRLVPKTARVGTHSALPGVYLKETDKDRSLRAALSYHIIAAAVMQCDHDAQERIRYHAFFLTEICRDRVCIRHSICREALPGSWNKKSPL